METTTKYHVRIDDPFGVSLFTAYTPEEIEDFINNTLSKVVIIDRDVFIVKEEVMKHITPHEHLK